MAKEEKEFGGTLGAIGIMIFSHFVPFYFALSLQYNSGGLYFPASMNEFFENFLRKIVINILWTIMSLFKHFPY
mgnify:CR=1 FL=1